MKPLTPDHLGQWSQKARGRGLQNPLGSPFLIQVEVYTPTVRVSPAAEKSIGVFRVSVCLTLFGEEHFHFSGRWDKCSFCLGAPHPPPRSPFPPSLPGAPKEHPKGLGPLFPGS